MTNGHEEDNMKKYLAIFATITFVLSAAIIAYAGHDLIVIPYEKAIFGYKTMMPIPSGGDIRHHIIGHEPYKKWDKWPGKGEMYEGKEPHGALLTTYVNDIARKSIKKKKGMANNSMIVKENHAPNKKLVAVSVMYKVKGYNPEGGDWFWAQYDANFEVLSEGNVKACMDCHETAKNNDYIFTGEVK
jgi:hypothetical protein